MRLGKLQSWSRFAYHFNAEVSASSQTRALLIDSGYVTKHQKNNGVNCDYLDLRTTSGTGVYRERIRGTQGATSRTLARNVAHVYPVAYVDHLVVPEGS